MILCYDFSTKLCGYPAHTGDLLTSDTTDLDLAGVDGQPILVPADGGLRDAVGRAGEPNRGHHWPVLVAWCILDFG